LGEDKYSIYDAYDVQKSKQMMLIYWKKYANKKTCEELSKIHNGGHKGWSKKSTQSYWIKIREEMMEMKY
jgi:hypothetical protein